MTTPNEQDQVDITKNDPNQDILLDHAYDGIQEYDNPLPGWWSAIFFGSFVFALGYFFFYHMGGPGSSIHKNYQQEVQTYKELKARLDKASGKIPVDKLLADLQKDTKALARGKELFLGKGTCYTCHNRDAGGGIGPNLTDDYWIHGPYLSDIYRVITKGGRKGKGMIAWAKKIKKQDRLNLSVYIYSLRGQKPKKAKPPEEGNIKYKYPLPPQKKKSKKKRKK